MDEALASWLALGPLSFGLCWAVKQLGRAERFLEALEDEAGRTLWTEPARAVALEHYVRAADLYAQIGSLPDEAHARLRAGQAGDREQLERALGFYRSVGATRYIREGEALLAASA